jgi:hypothetical protein
MRARVLAIFFVALSATLVAQSPPATGSAKTWQGRNAAIEEYLRTAPFEKIQEVPIGVTKPMRGYFPEGGLVRSAAWKQLPPGRTKGYWESYRSEIAAYELDKFFAMDMVPPVVEKRWKHELGAAVLWVEPVRSWKDVENLPKPDHWHIQVIRMKMFDNLIGNIDRNAGNLLVDADWNLYLIDHSRAFISETKLPVVMSRIDSILWERMLAIDEATLTTAIGKWVDRGSIRAMLKRRDVMKTTIETMLKTKPQALVFVK